MTELDERIETWAVREYGIDYEYEDFKWHIAAPYISQDRDGVVDGVVYGYFVCSWTAQWRPGVQRRDPYQLITGGFGRVARLRLDDEGIRTLNSVLVIE